MTNEENMNLVRERFKEILRQCEGQKLTADLKRVVEEELQELVERLFPGQGMRFESKLSADMRNFELVPANEQTRDLMIAIVRGRLLA